MACNVVSALRGLALEPAARNVRLKKFRLVVTLAGRMSRFRCVLRLRFCAPVEAIRRVKRSWEAFALPPHAPRVSAFSGRESPPPAPACPYPPIWVKHLAVRLPAGRSYGTYFFFWS